MSTMDALFAEINSIPLTTKVPVVIKGKTLKGRNELPLMSQAIANAVATTVWGISSPRGQSNIQKTIERSVNRKFLPYVNAISLANKKSMHHLYEWNKVGQTSARLFNLVIPATSRGKANFTMRVDFKPSKTLVPLTQAQSTPGPNGRVVEKKHVFYNKAMVMEYGQTVVVRPKNTKYMAFDNPPGTTSTLSGLTFTSRPVTIKYAQRQTYHGLQNTITSFFSGYGNRSITEDVTAYTRRLTRAAGKTTHMIKVAVPSDAYAHSVASKVTNAMMPVG